MSSVLATIFYSPSCTNCQRFMDSVKRVQTLAGRVQTVDISSLRPDQLKQIPAVPAVHVANQQGLRVGSKAFEWLATFDGDVELVPAILAGGALAFSDIEGSGDATYAGMYSNF